MSKFVVTPEALSTCLENKRKIANNAEIDSIISQVNAAAIKFVETNSKGHPVEFFSVYFTNEKDQNVRSVVSLMISQGYKAKFSVNEEYDDGPNRYTPRTCVITIAA